MKDIKTIIIVIVIIAVVAFIGLGAMKKSNEFSEVKKYVTENKEELEKIANDYLEGNKTKTNKEIEEVTLHEDNTDKLVFFKLKNKDKNSKSVIGFYYSKNNIPSALEKKHIDIIELGGEKYKWDDDNTAGITNKIEDNWYFYKKTK